MLSIQKASTVHSSIVLDRNITDLLKFVACIMVAMSHYSGYVLAEGVSSSVIYKAVAANGGYLGVAIFFFLSGYGLMKSDQKRHRNIQEFCKRRLAKAWLPAVIVSTIWLTIAYFVDLDLLCNSNHYLLGILWWFNDEVMWFIRVILIMYVCMYVYSSVSHRLARSKPFLLTAIAIIAYLVVRMLNIGSSLSVPLFFLGMAIAEFPKFFKTIFSNILVIMALIVIAAMLAWFFRHDNYLLHGLINYFGIGVLLIVFANFNITLSQFAPWIGNSSLDVYLVHYKVHLLILHYVAIDTLWMFLLGTAISAFLFYKFRKLIRL